MSQYIEFDFMGDYDVNVDPIISSQSATNVYLSYDISKSYTDNPQTIKSYISIPGSQLALSFSDQPYKTEVRNCAVINGVSYWICGSGVYIVTEILSYIKIGTLLTTTGYVGISNNLTQIMFCDSAGGYIWDGSNFTKITSAGFPHDSFLIGELDGHLIVGQKTSNKFFISDSEDGLTWDPLNFAELTSKPENLTGGFVLNRRIYIVGQTCTEIWYSAGGTTFPFIRDNTIVFDYGGLALRTFLASHGSGFWLGTSEYGGISLIQTDGSSIKIASSIPVKLAFESYETVSDAVSYIYEINGHLFYEISFPTANKTWSYDISTDKWFIKSMLNDDRYFAQCHLYNNNTHYMGSYDQNAIFYIASDYTTNNGENIKFIGITRSFRLSSGNRIQGNTFELKLRQGNSNISGVSQQNVVSPIREPSIFLEISRDGGKTWGNKVRSQLGTQGEYEYRVLWRRLGIGEQFIFRVTIYSSFQVIILGCALEYNRLNPF